MVSRHEVSVTILRVADPVAVLVIGFNRSTELQRVLRGLAPQNVSKIYLWIDGPRPANSKDFIEGGRIRSLVDDIELPFPIVSNFQPANLGCGKSVEGALSWFFSQEEKGAILEDDCVPSPDFIAFIAEQLAHWESDESVLTISGNSLVSRWPQSQQSYHFSKYPHVWGWATWRRVWEKYDFEIIAWGELKNTDWLRKTVGLRPDAVRYWTYKFNALQSGRVDTWDYQLTFLSFLEMGRNIITHVNLVDNIGFGPNATHTKERPTGLVDGYGKFERLEHPRSSQVDEALDRFVELEFIRTKRGTRELLGFITRAFKYHAGKILRIT